MGSQALEDAPSRRKSHLSVLMAIGAAARESLAHESGSLGPP